MTKKILCKLGSVEIDGNNIKLNKSTYVVGLYDNNGLEVEIWDYAKKLAVERKISCDNIGVDGYDNFILYLNNIEVGKLSIKDVKKITPNYKTFIKVSVNGKPLETLERKISELGLKGIKTTRKQTRGTRGPAYVTGLEVAFSNDYKLEFD